MKRIHLFEFEDFPWFPSSFRVYLTRLMMVMHKLVNTQSELSELIKPLLNKDKKITVLDLCSGSEGPMPGVIESLNKEGYKVNLKLSDLYPDKSAVEKFSNVDDIDYISTPIDATNVDFQEDDLRTMVCSFHHMNKDVAKDILKSAFEQRKSICVFEISDNSYPKALWWIAIPFNIISCLLITPMVRPLTFGQLFFTYIIPVIPLFFAWDGAVSNARTYTLSDLDDLLKDFQSDEYVWEKGIVKGKSKKLYLIGKKK